ncbi:MAG: hypothetical protein RQ824_03585 [bacterium]|nr:hypothetical protein [bacterium]
MKRPYLIIVVALVAASLIFFGCKTTPEQRAAREKRRAEAIKKKEERRRQKELVVLRNLKEEEVYVVGRIELIPGLTDEELNLKTRGSSQMKDKVSMFYSNQFVDITNKNSFGLYRHMDVAKIGEHFVIKSVPKGKLYYSGAYMWLESAGAGFDMARKVALVNLEFLNLPGDRIYDLKPGTKAVYVGTWKYYRDEYNGIKKMKYVNEYKKANAVFKKVIGNPEIKLTYAKPKKQKGVW